jgi:hypothetical protein
MIKNQSEADTFESLGVGGMTLLQRKNTITASRVKTDLISLKLMHLIT